MSMEADSVNIFEKFSLCGEEIFTELFKNDLVKIERIVSSGQSSPEGFWYDQDEAEWVLVLEGQAVIEFFDGKKYSLNKGDSLFIDAHCKHRVASTKAGDVTLWLAVHMKV